MPKRREFEGLPDYILGVKPDTIYNDDCRRLLQKCGVPYYQQELKQDLLRKLARCEQDGLVSKKDRLDLKKSRSAPQYIVYQSVNEVGQRIPIQVPEPPAWVLAENGSRDVDSGQCGLEDTRGLSLPVQHIESPAAVVDAQFPRTETNIKLEGSNAADLQNVREQHGIQAPLDPALAQSDANQTGNNVDGHGASEQYLQKTRPAEGTSGNSGTCATPSRSYAVHQTETSREFVRIEGAQSLLLGQGSGSQACDTQPQPGGSNETQTTSQLKRRHSEKTSSKSDKPKPKKQTRQKCANCGKRKTSIAFQQQKIAEQCNHTDSTWCSECLASNINTAATSDEGWQAIECPICNAPMRSEEFNRHLTSESRKIYNDKLEAEIQRRRLATPDSQPARTA